MPEGTHACVLVASDMFWLRFGAIELLETVGV